MAVIWAPETQGDFDRIRDYNAKHYGETEGDAIEHFIEDWNQSIRCFDALSATRTLLDKRSPVHTVKRMNL